MQQKYHALCDFCEKKSIELAFAFPQDEEKFREYKLLPSGLNLLWDATSVKGGKIIWLIPLGISVVLCEECLTQNKVTVLQQLSEKPNLIRKAIENLDRVIAEDETTLAKKKHELDKLRGEAQRLEGDIQARMDYLVKQKDCRERLSKALHTILS